jgi:hypothetical protein
MSTMGKTSVASSLESGILGLMKGREGPTEQELQKQRDDEAAKQAEIKKKLKSFIGAKLQVKS